MSNNPERCTPPAEAWPLEKRREMMRDVITALARESCLRIGFAPAIAKTYGVEKTSVEAEMMKHLSEGEGK